MGRLTFGNRRYCERRGQPLLVLLGKTDFDLSPRPLAEQYCPAQDSRVLVHENSDVRVNVNITKTVNASL